MARGGGMRCSDAVFAPDEAERVGDVGVVNGAVAAEDSVIIRWHTVPVLGRALIPQLPLMRISPYLLDLHRLIMAELRVECTNKFIYLILI